MLDIFLKLSTELYFQSIFYWTEIVIIKYTCRIHTEHSLSQKYHLREEGNSKFETYSPNYC